MISRILTIAILLFTSIFPIVPSTGTIYAQEGDQPNSMVQWYADTYGLTYAEAQRRLELQSEMSELEAKVIAEESTYAGSWTVHEPKFGLVVAFASPDGEAIMQPYLEGIAWADLVIVQEAPYTAVELLAISEQVIPIARETGLLLGAGPNYQRSKVTLYTADPEELRRQMETKEAIELYLADIEYLYETSGAVPTEPVPLQDEQNTMVRGLSNPHLDLAIRPSGCGLLKLDNP